MGSVRGGLTPRRATDADIPDLVALNGEVQSWHAEHYPHQFKSEVDPSDLEAFFQKTLDRSDARIWVIGAPALAYLFATIQTRAEGTYTHALTRVHVEHLVTTKAARRQGHAAALLVTVEAAARDIGADEMTLDTWVANAIAQQTFAKAGLEITRLWYAKRL